MTPENFFSYNARFLEAERVSRSFVSTKQFGQLAQSSNSVLLGPRGSGKTTFFKMLTIPALNAWTSNNLKKILALIDYVAIYVPTDFMWHKDYRQEVRASSDPETDRACTYAKFRTSLLRQIIRTIQIIIDERNFNNPALNHFFLKADQDVLEKFSKIVAQQWGLVPEFSGLDGIVFALNDRTQYIDQIHRMSQRKNVTYDELVEEHDFLSASFFNDLKAFADVFDSIFDAKSKWALCFDEVEIAPESVKKEIWGSLRSFDQRFIVKLSASPYDNSIWSVDQPKTAMQISDYDLVSMGMPRPEVMEFSSSIFEKICNGFGIIPSRKGKSILGSSYYDEDFDEKIADQISNRNKGAKASGGQNNSRSTRTNFYQTVFESLRKKDPSFDQFLKKRGVKTENIANVKGNGRATIRKHISTVVLRDAYVRSKKIEDNVKVVQNQRLKSKNRIDLFFTGERTIFTMCEGNPRFLLAVLQPMVQKYVEEGTNPKNYIPRRKQVNALESGVHALLAVLATISTDRTEIPKEPAFLDLLNTIGTFFYDEVMGEHYKSDPFLSFEIDEDVSEAQLDLIGAALNQGAFIHESNARNPRTVDFRDPEQLVGMRLRISYFLAPTFRLPLVLGKEKALSSILQHKKNQSSEMQTISDLFGHKR